MVNLTFGTKTLVPDSASFVVSSPISCAVHGDHRVSSIVPGRFYALGVGA
jgi:hypothetical protein